MVTCPGLPGLQLPKRNPSVVRKVLRMEAIVMMRKTKRRTMRRSLMRNLSKEKKKKIKQSPDPLNPPDTPTHPTCPPF